MDGRKNNRGTIGNKGGRPPKADEILLIEKLSPLDEDAFEALAKGVKAGDVQFVKLFMAYRWGAPKQTIDQHNTGDREIIVTYEDSNQTPSQESAGNTE